MIVVVGGYGRAVSMRVVRAPEAGETVTGHALVEGHGGKGSNQAVGVARLGVDAAIVTAVGDDGPGRSARALWAAEGVRDRAVTIPDLPTMTGLVLVEPTGENRIAVAPGALGALTPDDVAAGLAGLTPDDVVLVSLEVAHTAARAAVEVARAAGARTVLDPAPVGPGASALLPLADVLTPNNTELGALLHAHTPTTEGALVRCAGRLRHELAFTGTLVVTLGSGGALVDDGEGHVLVHASAATEVVDTTGAGDAFAAALAVALHDGEAAPDAVRFAAVAAALSVALPGVVEALPTRSALDRRLEGAGSHPR